MSWTQTSAPAVNWQSVASSSDGTKLVAVFYGGIYTNSNSGNGSWILQNGAGTRNWSSVASSSDGTKLVAVVFGGGIYTSIDSGVTWTLQSGASTTADWQSVASSSDGSKLVAVASSPVASSPGNICTNSNYGNGSWTRRNGSAGNRIWLSVASSSDGTKLVAVVGGGGIWTNSNSGSGSWTPQSSPPTNAGWDSVASSSDGKKLVAVLGGGGIYTGITSDYINWTWTQTSAPPTSWRSVASSSDGTKLVALASYGGGIYTGITSDYISWTWTLQSGTGTQNWIGVASSSDGTKLVAVVSNGGIWTYPDVPYPCFKEDSKILTKIGYIPIQKLRKGDLVKTLNHGFVPINMIGYRILNNPICEERIKDKLYVCHQSEYPEVFEDLVITGCHAILVDEFKNTEEREKTNKILGDIYVTDKKYRLPACVDERTKPYEESSAFKIYHVALDNDDSRMNYGIYANGLLVESTSQRYLKELSGMTLLHPLHL